MAKRIAWTTLWIFALLLASVVPASSASAQATFPLVCKGTNLFVSASSTGAQITFVRYPQGAGVTWNALTPGSCAWVDRPVSSAEPNRLCYRGSGPFSLSWTTRPAPHVEQAFNDRQGCLRVA